MKTSYKPSKLPAIAAQVRKEHPTSSEIKNYQLDNTKCASGLNYPKKM